MECVSQGPLTYRQDVNGADYKEEVQPIFEVLELEEGNGLER